MKMKWKTPDWIFLASFCLPQHFLWSRNSPPAALTPKQMQEERAKVQWRKRYEAAIQSYQDY